MMLRGTALLLVLSAVVSSGAQTTTRITVDAAANRHPISPLIYGIAFGTAHVLADLNAPLNRAGGDNVSLYNWQLNARSAGSDFFFESAPATDRIVDQYGDGFVDVTRQGNSTAMLGIPMTGWVAKLGPNRSKLAAFSITKYGLQKATDLHGLAEAGNGITLDGKFIKNDPTDAAQPDTIGNQAAFVRHLVGKYKAASQGGVAYYGLDNEPSRWHDIHRDVQPVGLHAQELATRSIAYARMIKSVDPTSKVLGPEEWGWPGYLHSGFDQQLGELGDKTTPSDRLKQTNGMDMIPWLLTQWKAAGAPVDILSVHYYPQSGEYTNSGDTSDRMQLLRNRSTRSLWDPTYKDQSWINDTVALIPRLRKWADTFYKPGTPIAITEYNWGAENSMGGATAQADILGIFGRERLDMATRWIAPAEGSPVYLSMKLFRNYDGKRNGFGDTSVLASTPDADRVAAFAATRSSDNALTVVAINKQIHDAAPVDLSLAHFADGGLLQTVTLINGRLQINTPQPYSNSSLHSVLPPQSITMMIFRPNAR